MLESLILRWGYLAVGLGTFFEGEAVVIIAGALAHRGLLSLPWVMGAAFAGAVAGDQVWFHVGRWLGKPLIERHHRLRARAGKAQAWLTRYGAVFVLGFRFVYGIRTATPMFLGASGYPTRLFLLLNTVGGACWAAVIAGVGWLLGASLASALGRKTHLVELLAAVGVALGVMWLVARLVQRRLLKRGK